MAWLALPYGFQLDMARTLPWFPLLTGSQFLLVPILNWLALRHGFHVLMARTSYWFPFRRGLVHKVLQLVS